MSMERSKDWIDEAEGDLEHAPHEKDTPRKRRRGLLNMPKKFSSPVQVFYPKFSREEIIQAISRSLGNLGRELPLLLVVLFGSYARGNYTVASDVDLLVVYAGKEKKRSVSLQGVRLLAGHCEGDFVSRSNL